jgi:predicted outer membrane repeat protein
MITNKQRYGRIRLVSLFFIAVLFSGLVLSLGPISTARAASITVTNLNDSGPGSLRQAITDANTLGGTNTIDLTGLTGTITLSSVLPTIQSPLSLLGPGASKLTISGDNKTRIMYIQANITIDSLTLSNGYSSANGGAIVTTAGAATILNSNFINNKADGDGGAFMSFNQSTSKIINCLFDGNKANNGGALYTRGAAFSITASTFVNNSSNQSGGAIYDNEGLIMRNSTFANNSGHDGGALYIWGSYSYLINSTVSGNKAIGGSGGGINYNYSPPSSLQLVNSTITDNQATLDGGGISTFGTVWLSNSLIALNTVSVGGDGPDLSNRAGGSIDTQGYNLIGIRSTSGYFYPATGDRYGTPANPLDPKIAPLADNGGPTKTHALLPGSPAIDAANTANCESTDQRYVARVGECDIGAYEFNGVLPVAPAISKSFSPSSILVGETTAVQFTLSNPNSSGSLTGVGFSDKLPAQLKVAANPAISNGCGNPNGTINAPANSDTITVSGVTLSANQTCTIKVDVTSSVAGNWPNTTSAVTATETTAGTTSNTAILSVCDPLVVNNNQDNGATCGTLRFALGYINSHAGLASKIININLPTTPATIQLTGSALNIPAGVTINGVCNATTKKPDITLDGSALTGPGLILNGKDTLNGLKITGFQNKQIQALKNANKFKCVAISRK